MNRSAVAFYFGTFLTTLGSMTFNICLVAFMLQSGFQLVHVSLIIGLQRFIPTLIMGGFGHVTDRWNPRKTVIILEVGAAITSLALLLLWEGPLTNYPVFMAVCVIRATIVNFQTGSKSRITKMLADSSYSSNARHAILQMVSTQGANIFAGVAGLVLIKFLTLKSAIILDLLTFFANGIFMLLVNFKNESVFGELKTETWRQKFSDLFRYNPQAAVLDILLAISIAGLISFIARVSGDNHIWNAIFMTGYGLSVWVSGYFERSFARKFSTVPFWIILAVSFVLIGTFQEPGFILLGIMFLKDLSYWVILHRVSGHIQADSPLSHIGSVASARFSIMVVILSIGEIIVGAWSPFVPLWVETLLRGGVALSVGIYLLSKNGIRSKVVAGERPAL